jgi:hypothetical protein
MLITTPWLLQSPVHPDWHTCWNYSLRPAGFAVRAIMNEVVTVVYVGKPDGWSGYVNWRQGSIINSGRFALQSHVTFL